MCFADGALGGGGFFGLWTNTEMKKSAVIARKNFHPHTVNPNQESVLCRTPPLPPSRLPAASQSCLERHPAFPRSHPSTSRHQHSPAHRTMCNNAEKELEVHVWMQIIFW